MYGNKLCFMWNDLQPMIAGDGKMEKGKIYTYDLYSWLIGRFAPLFLVLLTNFSANLQRLFLLFKLVLKFKPPCSHDLEKNRIFSYIFAIWWCLLLRLLNNDLL